MFHHLAPSLTKHLPRLSSEDHPITTLFLLLHRKTNRHSPVFRRAFMPFLAFGSVFFSLKPQTWEWCSLLCGYFRFWKEGGDKCQVSWFLTVVSPKDSKPSVVSLPHFGTNHKFLGEGAWKLSHKQWDWTNLCIATATTILHLLKTQESFSQLQKAL